jgi:hypothetical protein
MFQRPLQRLRDQPMLRLDDIILAPGPLGLVPGLPELQVDGPTLSIYCGGRGRARSQSRFDGTGTEDSQDLALDGLVDAEAAKGEAPSRPVIEGRTAAAIPGDVPFGPRVRDMQAAATLPTAEQPRKQTGSSSHRAAHHQPLHLGIVAHERTNPLVGLPGNIGVVVVTEQRDPGLPWPPVATGLVRLAVDDGRSGFGPPEGIGPRVEGIGQELQDRVVDGEPWTR